MKDLTFLVQTRPAVGARARSRVPVGVRVLCEENCTRELARLLPQCHAYVYGSWRSPSGNEVEADVAEVGAPEGKKVPRSLLRKAKQFLIL